MIKQENKFELIKITEQDGKQLVSARELHEFLEIKTRFDTWFNRMIEYGFSKNKDFIAIAQKRATAQGNETTYIDYLMQLSMAKELSMLQRNNKGKEAMEYFIKCEEAWNSEEMVIARAMQIQHRKLLSYEQTIKNLQYQLIEYKDKAIIADTIAATEDSISIGELAKILSKNNEIIGQNKLYSWLRSNGYLIKRDGHDYNMPTQKSVNLGVIELVEKPVVYERSIILNKKSMITGKGQAYFIKKFRKGNKKAI